ncbi:transmembrane protein [Ninove microtus virus]|uniref:Transmembrane protein n=1 Tax=Ninove microtus virus TaxID=2940990 RepID=A0AAE9HU21_9MONO|nr:transmembrane protein [Ninove microtus virus]
MKMVTDYEEPTTCGSGYDSVRPSTITYKASTARSNYRASTPRRVRIVKGQKFNQGYSMVIMVIILAVQMFTFATLCYMLISFEGRQGQGCKWDSTKVKIDIPAFEEKLNQVAASVNTLINAVSFTLPQVLNNNKAVITQRMNYMISELREIVKLNALNVDLRMGLNKSFSFRSGHGMKAEKVSIRPTSSTALTTRVVPYTLVPPSHHTHRPNLPLTRVKSDGELDELTKNLMNTMMTDTEGLDGTFIDYLGLTGFMKKR